MRNKNILTGLVLLCLLFTVLYGRVFAVNYQTEVNRYLSAIKQNINQKPDWQKGFALAKKNIENLELCLHNMRMEAQEKRKTDPKYIIQVSFYNPVAEKMNALIKSGKKVSDYMTELQNNYTEMNEANYENKMRALSNMAKSMTKWSLRIGSPDITDLDISEEKKRRENFNKRHKRHKRHPADDEI